METIQSANSNAHVNSLLITNINCHAWTTTMCDSVAQATLPILNSNLPYDNTCHHDSSTNRHVLHNKTMFENYDSIAPLTIKGFRNDLSATAISQGTVCLKGYHEYDKCFILLQDVLHIPDARINLVSGIQLDKDSVVTTIGHNTIQLYSNNKIIVSRKLVNDMYQLNMRIIKPHKTPLASRIMDHSPITNPKVSLVSRIGSKHVTLDFYTTLWGI
jgi:Pol polyprotein